MSPRWVKREFFQQKLLVGFAIGSLLAIGHTVITGDHYMRIRAGLE